MINLICIYGTMFHSLRGIYKVLMCMARFNVHDEEETSISLAFSHCGKVQSNFKELLEVY